MADVRFIRFVAVVGSVVSAVAYLTFALLNENGDGWWHANKLWATIGLAPFHVLAAWTLLAVCGVTAYALRRHLARRPLAVTAVLIGLPTVWTLGLVFLYYDQLGWWPGFEGEHWRWLASHVYAEFAVGYLIGFVALVGFTMHRHPRVSAT